MSLINDKYENKLFNQETIAKEISVSTATVSNWLKSVKIDKHINFIKFLKLLDISMDEFLEEYDK